MLYIRIDTGFGTPKLGNTELKTALSYVLQSTADAAYRLFRLGTTPIKVQCNFVTSIDYMRKIYTTMDHLRVIAPVHHLLVPPTSTGKFELP